MVSSNLYRMLVPPLPVAFYPSFSLSPERLCTQESLNDGNFPGGPVFKNPPCNATDACSVPDQGTKITCLRETKHTATTTPAQAGAHVS